MLLKKTHFFISVTTCHPCYFWLVTGMTVTGMTKSMHTRIYFAFWKQKLVICLHSNIEAYDTFSVLGRFFFSISAFCSYKKVGNRDDI